jgi:hypothetical protein
MGFDNRTRDIDMDAAFLQQIIDSQYQLPKGHNLIDITVELMTYLGSTDAEMRDNYAYNILSRWITLYDYHTPDEMRAMIDWLLPRLQTEIGSYGNDSVFERSYAVLILSLIAYRDTRSSFLSSHEINDLLLVACNYLLEEKDSRAYVPGQGWANAYAHAADLLRFLMYSPLVTPDQQILVISNVADKVMTPTEDVYLHDEDDRLARVVVAVLRRSEVPTPDLDWWLRRFSDWKRDYQPEGDYDRIYTHTHQNIKLFLRALLVQVEVMEYLPRVADEFQPLLLATVRAYSI